MNTAYLISQDGIVTLFHDSKSHTISSDHVNYNAILDALNDGDYEALDDLLDVPEAIRRVDGRVRVENDRVFFDDFEIVGPVADRLIHFIREQLPYKPLVRFVERLMENPSSRSVNELYGFLEHRGMPITDDGCFVAYKGVRGDFYDRHSGKFLNRPGERLAMARNRVDDNRDNTCSYGFHVGSQAYASNWAGSDGRVVAVKVDPAHAVSVPSDHDAQKLRVSEYLVLAEIEKTHIFQDGLFRQEDIDDDDPDDFDMCEDRGEYYDNCTC